MADLKSENASDNKLSPLKVSFRDEGYFIVCYIAETTGEWFEELGRIHKRLIQEDEKLWHQYRDFMVKIGLKVINDVLNTTIKQVVYIEPELLENKKKPL